MQAGASVAGFEAKGEFDRRDYGVNFEGALENGILVVGNKIVVQITVEAHEKTETAA
jgi:polyisoprenoid-binding protein YceI